MKNFEDSFKKYFLGIQKDSKKIVGCTCTPGMSMTNGSEGSLGKETPPSAVRAVTRNRYKMPDNMLESVSSGISVEATWTHS